MRERHKIKEKHEYQQEEDVDEEWRKNPGNQSNEKREERRQKLEQGPYLWYPDTMRGGDRAREGAEVRAALTNGPITVTRMTRIMSRPVAKETSSASEVVARREDEE